MGAGACHRGGSRIYCKQKWFIVMMTTLDADRLTWRDALRDALQHWHTDKWLATPLATLAIFQQARRHTDTDRHALNQVLLSGLDRLERSHPQEATLLRQRYLDGRSVHVMANRLNVSQSTVYALQRVALDHLRRVVAEMEADASRAIQLHLEARLPLPTTTALVGIEEVLGQIREVLLQAGPPWILTLEGMGGIGKTSLAHRAVYEVMQAGGMEAVGWVSAQRNFLDAQGHLQQETQPVLTTETFVAKLGAQVVGTAFVAATLTPDAAFEAVHAKLKTQPHLIVLDNLETFADVDGLLPTLRRLSDPSKFLLTSRYHLPPQSQVWSLSVPELNESRTLQLVRQEARFSNQPDLRDAPDHTLRPIYTTVGGNPLAVRLVVGQAYVYGLATVLEDLRGARGQSVTDLYTYIYRQIWESLPEPARRLLLAMPLISETGGGFDLLAGTSQLAPEAVRQALEVLVLRNLVDVRGDLSVRRYGIHSLTRTFLLHQIAQW